MKANYIEKNDYDKKMSSKEYPDLRYYGGKTYRELYHDSDCQLIGAIGDGLDKTACGNFLYDGEDHAYYALTYDHKKYQIEGYIVVGDKIHLAIITKQTKKKPIVPIIAICVCLIACLVAGGALWKLNTSNSNMDANAKEYTPKNAPAVQADPNHIVLPGYDDLKMKAGSDMLYVSLWNPSSNPCNFQFEISLKNGEKLYESKLVAPGKAITQVKLNRKFKKGVYDIVISMNAFSLNDDHQKMNSGKVNTRLIAVE